MLERVLPGLRATFGEQVPIDLVTCYGGLPEGLGPETAVYRVTDYGSKESRNDLIRELRARRYSVAAMICSAEPIMTKWKWLIALRVPAKFLIINENGDYFWLDRTNAGIIREFVLVRCGLSGTGAWHTIGRVLMFPFAVLYLLLYAFAVHARRALRLAVHPELRSPR